MLTHPNKMTNNSTNNSSGGPAIGLLPVAIYLEVIGEHHGAAAVAHSALLGGGRAIVVKLCSPHPLVARALTNSDFMVIRFLIGTALAEYSLFWSNACDGVGVRNALRALVGIPPSEESWGTQFASRLADCKEMAIIDTLPVYSTIVETGPHSLFAIEVKCKTPSDIPRWRIKGEKGRLAIPMRGLPEWAGPVERGEADEPPLRPSSSPPGPIVEAEPSPRSLRRQEQRAAAAAGLVGAPATPVVEAVTAPDLFKNRFYQVVKEMLPLEDFAMLKEMAKEVRADVS